MPVCKLDRVVIESQSMKKIALIAVAGALLSGCAGNDIADLLGGESAQEHRGEVYALQNCASCHEIGARGASPRATSPAFGEIRARYSRLSLERELQAISTSGHYDMKPIRIEQTDIDDLVAYIQGLK